MKIKVICFTFCLLAKLSASVHAQQPVVRPPSSTPVIQAQQEQLTTTESIAIDATLKEGREQLQTIAADIAKSHPGYKLDMRTLTLVPIAPTPASQPATPPSIAPTQASKVK